eukprot:NODE_1908_length_1339_cov_7.976898_g1813_i0.p1 GENE.NODE_1908_length_1339_cov_7.976898_g1813_i0~~NODE_1908_length_1339_cov_7.976898_g1813_i0.p1  ORF type:complete len:440 (-),score=91.36 NODE_1908_length_1339_cov_7.976898_g1813_i0:20-1303(-)
MASISRQSEETQRKHKQQLKEFLKHPANRECMDCTCQGPTWASLNLGIFLCARCSGLHRKVGVHISKIRSCTLDLWEPQWIKAILAMGNARGKEVYEARLPEGYPKPDQSESNEVMEQWIRAKYELKRYWKTQECLPARRTPPPASPISQSPLSQSPQMSDPSEDEISDEEEAPSLANWTSPALPTVGQVVAVRRKKPVRPRPVCEPIPTEAPVAKVHDVLAPCFRAECMDEPVTIPALLPDGSEPSFHTPSPPLPAPPSLPEETVHLPSSFNFINPGVAEESPLLIFDELTATQEIAEPDRTRATQQIMGMFSQPSADPAPQACPEPSQSPSPSAFQFMQPHHDPPQTRPWIHPDTRFQSEPTNSTPQPSPLQLQHQLLSLQMGMQQLFGMQANPFPSLHSQQRFPLQESSAHKAVPTVGWLANMN